MVGDQDYKAYGTNQNNGTLAKALRNLANQLKISVDDGPRRLRFRADFRTNFRANFRTIFAIFNGIGIEVGMA